MQYALETWFERDRAYIGLYPADADGRPDTNKEPIVEFWDDGLADMIESGFIDPENYLQSTLKYANVHGLTALHDQKQENENAN